MDQNCKHEELIFSSGDYYVGCPKCYRSWVIRAANNDAADSSKVTPGFADNEPRVTAAKARDDALEEAAKFCEQHEVIPEGIGGRDGYSLFKNTFHEHEGHIYAAAIRRAAKDKRP